MDKKFDLIMYCGEELQEAHELLNRERNSDGTRQESRHNVQVAQTHALIAIGLALKAIAQEEA